MAQEQEEFSLVFSQVMQLSAVMDSEFNGAKIDIFSEKGGKLISLKGLD